MLRYVLYVLLLLVLSVGVVYAQTESCEADLVSVMATVADNCDALARNEACFGNPRIESEVAGDNQSFIRIGDIVAVDELLSLQTYPLSLDDEEWGIAVLSVQANLPETLPGQNVTIILFGDAEVSPPIEDDSGETFGTMEAFYLTTGVGMTACP